MSGWSHLIGVLQAAWDMLTMASPYIFLGLFIAGLMRAFIKSDRIARYLGGNDLKSVGLAAISGVPLPLCSCGVVPTAMGLRQQGASKPATVAFLISTPESGIDSIAVTYALLGPIMAIIRPVAAFITAFVAGVAQILCGEGEITRTVSSPAPSATLLADRQSSPQRVEGIAARLTIGLHYAFVDLLRDISGWFLVGILLGGIISYAIPESFIHTYLGTGWQSLFVMLAIGIPLYICASASTPIAAALMLKGMSPGAAVVFLLAGPATNAASLPVLVKFLGKRAVAIYLGAIAICSILIGMLVNWLYTGLRIDPLAALTHTHHPLPDTARTGVAIALLALIAYDHLTHRLHRQSKHLQGGRTNGISGR